MSLLANALIPHVAGRPPQEISDLTNNQVSRETLRRTMDGSIVPKLSNLRALRKALKLSEDQWAIVLCAWIETVIGSDAPSVIIAPKPRAAQKLQGKEANAIAAATTLFRSLRPKDREQILLTMARREVLNCLPPINHGFTVAKASRESE